MGAKSKSLPSKLEYLCVASTEHAPLPIATVDGSKHTVRYANPAFCRMMGKSVAQLVGKSLRTLLPANDGCVTLLDRVFQTGTAATYAEPDRSQAHPVFWSYTMWPVEADKRLVGIMIQVSESGELHDRTVAMNEALMLGSLRQHELTAAAENLNAQLQRAGVARKRAAGRMRLLWEAARVLLSTDDPEALLHGLFAKIAPALGVDTYSTYMVDESGGALRLVSHTGISKKTARSIAQLKFGQSICGAVAVRRQAVHASRIQQSGDPQAKLLKAMGLQAYVCNPLMSGNRLMGTLSYGSRSREQFEAEELSVLQTLSHYVALAYERLQGAEALRASEDRYRTLFNSIDEGFCVIEMIADRKGRPADYRFLEVNPSFATQSGIRNGVGKRIRELSPKVEAYWLETYGKVARTGVPQRFSHEMRGLNRWFDVYAFPLGGPDNRKVAVLFSNITDRKRAELALREARAQLAAHAHLLERQVVARTAELTTANRRLKASVHTVVKAQEEYRSLLVEAQVMQKKLRHVTRQMITAQEEERKQISRELHDEVVQTLIGINVELSALGGSAIGNLPLLRKKIAHTRRLVEESVHAVHRFARGLRPAVLDDLGLIPALHTLCKGVAEKKKIKIEMVAFGGVETLGSAERTVLFRVAQEALNNVVRHARATRVKISIRSIPQAIRMEIADNGRSFQVAETLGSRGNKRLGLVGMRERAEMVGGTLAIDSVPGRGTTVRVDLPFTPAKAVK